MSISVLLADDKEMVRKAILFLLQTAPDIQIVGQAASFAQTLELASKLHPQVILLDVQMEDDYSGTTAQLKSGFMGSRVLVTSIWADDETSCFAKAIGAETLLDKSTRGIELIPAIRKRAIDQNRESCNGLASATLD